MSLNPQSDLALAALTWVHSQDYVNMTLRQAALLAVICDEPGPHTVRGLAEALGVSKAVVSRAVHALMFIGLAGRRSDPSDRRSVLVDATVSGRAIRSAMAGHAGKTLERLSKRRKTRTGMR